MSKNIFSSTERTRLFDSHRLSKWVDEFLMTQHHLVRNFIDHYHPHHVGSDSVKCRHNDGSYLPHGALIEILFVGPSDKMKSESSKATNLSLLPTLWMTRCWVRV